MKKLLIALTVALVLTGCSDAPRATKALTQAGYTDIKTTGYSYFGCDEKDVYHTTFNAKGPTGIYTEGVVCSGWFKSNTIRLD